MSAERPSGCIYIRILITLLFFGGVCVYWFWGGGSHTLSSPRLTADGPHTAQAHALGLGTKT